MPGDPVVHVIDDDDAARDSLAFLLGTAQLSVRTYESATSFLDALASVESGCVITDVRMPDIDGIELLRRLKSLNIGLPVIVITGHADFALAVEALRQGAVDLIEKPYDGDVLLGAVRASFNLAEKSVVRESARDAIREGMATLSPRERQVLDGLLAGQSSRAIAHDLGTNESTVGICRANAMTKLNATSISHLVRLVLIAES